MKTTSQIKTTPSIGKTSIAKPTTGASSTTQTAEFKPPTSTKSVKFEPVKASVISNGTQKEMKIQNIAMSSQFNNLYTPEELRFFDYITDKKITAPQTQGAEPILKSMTPKIPETKPQGSSTQAISLKGSQTAADKDKKNIKKDNIQFPDPKAAEILTAAEFFKAKKIEKRLQAAEQEFLSYSLLLSNLLCFKSFNRPSGMSDFRVRFVKGSHCVPDRAPGIPEKNESRFRLFRQQEKRGKISGIPLKLLEILTNAVCDFRRVSLSGHRNPDPEKEEIKDLKSAFFRLQS